MKDERLYLLHMSESIDRIVDFTASGRDAFIKDKMVQDAVFGTLRYSVRRPSELRTRHGIGLSRYPGDALRVFVTC